MIVWKCRSPLSTAVYCQMSKQLAILCRWWGRKKLSHMHTTEGRHHCKKELEDCCKKRREACLQEEGRCSICPKTYFRNLNVQFICLETKMTPKTKFRMLNMQFASSETRMRLEANFREPNLHLTSSHRDKFEDSWWCLFLFSLQWNFVHFLPLAEMEPY